MTFEHAVNTKFDGGHFSEIFVKLLKTNHYNQIQNALRSKRLFLVINYRYVLPFLFAAQFFLSNNL